MGFDFIVIAPLLPSHCGFSFVFGCGVSLLVSSSVFLSMIVQQLVVILVFSQEGVRAHPSTPPSWVSVLFDPVYLCFLPASWMWAPSSFDWEPSRALSYPLNTVEDFITALWSFEFDSLFSYIIQLQTLEEIAIYLLQAPPSSNTSLLSTAGLHISLPFQPYLIPNCPYSQHSTNVLWRKPAAHLWFLQVSPCHASPCNYREIHLLLFSLVEFQIGRVSLPMPSLRLILWLESANAPLATKAIQLSLV